MVNIAQGNIFLLWPVWLVITRCIVGFKFSITVTLAEITSYRVYFGPKFSISGCPAEYFKPLILLMLKCNKFSSSCEVKMVFCFRDVFCIHCLAASNFPSIRRILFIWFLVVKRKIVLPKQRTRLAKPLYFKSCTALPVLMVCHPSKIALAYIVTMTESLTKLFK
jgi:hypothetical protein